MNKYWLYISLFLLSFLGFGICSAQAQRHCGTPQAIQDALQNHPTLIKKYERILHTPPSVVSNQSIARGMPVAVIPVVVHVVLQDPDAVTDAQIQSQIAVLNEDYQFLNKDTGNIPPIWRPIAGDMKIKFCLAKRTPDNEPTNGIDRVTTTKSSFHITNAVRAVKHANMGGADAWNSHEYLNIWICNLAGDYLGLGTPPGIYPDNEQGVIIQYNAFGTVGNLLPNFNKGRSCTHEIGHFLNLLHLWGSSQYDSCQYGDLIADTPPQKKPHYGNPTFPFLADSCSPNFPGIMINNFMGYANDVVMDMFTQDQVNRAKSALFTYRADLLTSNGCVPVHLENVDARLKSISSPSGKLCNGTVAPIVTLQNYGKNDLTAVDFKYQINNNPYKTFHWSGHLESLDSTKISLPGLSVSVGNYQLRVFTTQPNGVTDEKLQNDTLTTSFHLDPVITSDYTEGFESATYPPEGWTINNPDHRLTWERTHQAAHKSSHSIVMKNFTYNENGPIDEIISPVFNLQNKWLTLLSFDRAAAVQSDINGANTYWDTLEVIISFNCGQSEDTVYKASGADLITTDNRYLYSFVPNANQWQRHTIDISKAIKDKGPFRIIFRNITNFENNVYLDNIQIKTKDINPNLKEKKIMVVPNPFSHQLKVEFFKKPHHLKAIFIYNALGQLVAQKSASAVTLERIIEFNLQKLPAGIYFVNILFKDKKVMKKVVKVE